MNPEELQRIVQAVLCEEIGKEVCQAVGLDNLTPDQVKRLGQYVMSERTRKYREGADYARYQMRAGV